MDVERPVRPPSRVWKAFARRWRGHPFLKLDPLYALPERFVHYLNREWQDRNRRRRRDKGRDLIGYDDLNFEYDLSRTVRLGFFLKRPVGIWLHTDSGTGRPVETANEEIDFEPRRGLPDAPRRLPATPGPWEPDQDGGEAHRNLTFRAYEMMERGIAREEAERIVAKDRGVQKDLARQRDGYLGWLIQQEEFWQDVRQAKAECGNEVAARGGMPVLNPESDAVSPDGLEYDAYYTPAGPEKEVYWVRRVSRKWCLAGLQTWELFAPQRPRLATDAGGPFGPDQGLTVSIPYPFLAGNRLDIAGLVSRLRAEHTPPHLRGWVGVADRVAAKSTKGSYDKSYRMYELLVLTLLNRYQDKLAGKLSILDEVLAGYLAAPAVYATAAGQDENVNAEQTRQKRTALFKNLRSVAPDFFPWL